MNVHNSIFITARVEKTQMSTNWWWMNKQKWYIHSTNYCSAIKSNSTTYLNPENMLNERSQIQNVTFCKIRFIWNDLDRQIHKVESRLVVARRCGGNVNEEWLLMGMGLLFRMKKILELGAMVVQPRDKFKTTEWCNLKGWILWHENYILILKIYKRISKQFYFLSHLFIV